VKEFATSIVRTLREHGFQAYLVGGCVRDLLLRRQPADYDIATDALPQQVMQLFPETFAIGVQFGVVLVPLPSGNGEDARDQSGFGHHGSVEVATFRSDLGYSDGRHPDEVKFSKSPQIDVQRRDFTINGLLLDPISGEVLDFVGGRKDLEAGLIRAIGDAKGRFAEDKLRMLRALRFAARFQYKIEHQTWAAIR
jgi:tRNA nucleotidyltransferase/poly(A) polymerase